MGEIDIECIWKDFYDAKKELNDDHPTVEDISTENPNSMWTCLGCGKDEKKEIEGGVLCCIDCGLIDPNNISGEAEWRSGMDENGVTKDPSRCGMPSDTELYSEQWGKGSIIQTNWKSSHKQRLMAKIAFQSSMNHRDRALHHAPLAHAELVAGALVVERLHGAVENVGAQRLVIRVPLAGAGRLHDLYVESLVAEEAFVACDEQGQVVDRVHHRCLDFLHDRASIQSPIMRRSSRARPP